jgi:hypothetical protein
MKCKNCGAELNNGKCEYCGSVFMEEMRYIVPNIKIDPEEIIRLIRKSPIIVQTEREIVR